MGGKKKSGKNKGQGWGPEGADLSVRERREVPPEQQLWRASGWAIVLDPLLALVNDEALWERMHARHAFQERQAQRGDAAGVRERLRAELELWMDAVQQSFMDNNPDHALGLWTGALVVLRDTRKRVEGKEHLAVLEAAIAATGDASFVATRDLIYAFDPLQGEGPYAGPAAFAIALDALASARVPTAEEEDAAEAAWAVEKVRREEAAKAEDVRRSMQAMEIESGVPEDAVTDSSVSSDDEEYSDEEDDDEEGDSEESGESEEDDQ